MIITQQDLKKRINYNKLTGEFSWLKSRTNIVAGSPAGSIFKNGYLRIRISGKSYAAHKLAFLYETGYYPIEQIDHKDLNKLNNSFSNLRFASDSQNKGNRKVQKNSISGYKGIKYTSGKYQAYITKDGTRYYLGRFSDLAEAFCFRQAVEIELFGEFVYYQHS